MTSSRVAQKCTVCAADLGSARSRLDTEGNAYCEPCFRELRAAVADETEAEISELPQFRCNTCGTAHPAAELSEVAGRLVCADCISNRKPEGNGQANGDGKHATGEADEITQIVDHLEGAVPRNLLAKVTCPHCWHTFGPEQVLWVSQHADLVGDPVLGPEAQARFLPSRFNAAGEALDSRDMPCQLLACPRCHLTIPRAIVETEPLFVSVIGAPASGKSHLLASMTWELRRVLRERFAITFNDADSLSNLSLHRYEETLFLAPETNRLVSIRKTELQGELYDQIRLGQQIISLPRPFLFTLRPQEQTPPKGQKAQPGRRLRTMCLYDNAGEHFHPGMDSASAPGTQHLAKSRALIFLFDPTQHPRFRERCQSLSQDPQLFGSARTQRQETVLTEAASRVRRYTGLSPQRKHDRPLLVVVSKADIWAPLLDADLDTEPLLPDPQQPGTKLGVVDLPRIERTSVALRKLLLEWMPEVIGAAEDFCQQIIYIPSSALGHGPEMEQETGMLGIRPRDIHPKWAAVPILYMYARWGAGLIPAARPAQRTAAPAGKVAPSAR
jgi:hypothetical protein